MARDLVAGIGDAADEIRLPTRDVAEHEEGRARARGFEQVEQESDVARHRARQTVPVDAAVRSPIVVEPFLDVDRERVRDGHAEATSLRHRLALGKLADVEVVGLRRSR